MAGLGLAYPQNSSSLATPSQVPLDAPVENTGRGLGTSLVRGFVSPMVGISANSAARDYYEALARGDAQAAAEHRQSMDRLAAEAASVAPRVTSVGDIHGPGDALDYGAQLLGGAPVTLGVPVAGGLAGAALGRFGGPAATSVLSAAGGLGAMYPGMRNAAVMEHAQEAQGAVPSAQEAQNVLRHAGWQAAAEAVPYAAAPMFSAPARMLGGRALMPVAKTLGGGITRDAILQGGLGAASTGIGQAMQNDYYPNRDTSHDAMGVVDAAVSNTLYGIPFGAGGHAGSKVHGAVGDGIDMSSKLGGAALTAGGKLARTVGGQGANLAADAWAARPKTMEEAAFAVGKGAAAVRTGVEDMATRFRERGNDTDIDTLLTPTARGRDQETWQADNVSRHSSADSMLKKIAEQPDAYPDYVHAAADAYAKSTRRLTSWKPLADALSDWKQTEGPSGVEAALAAFNEATGRASIATGEAAVAAHNFADNVRGAYGVERDLRHRKQNAQSVGESSERDPLDTILADAIKPHLGLRTEAARNSPLVERVAQGLRGWIEGGFSDSTGALAAPRELLRVLPSAPISGIKKLADIMYRQGTIDDSVHSRLDEALHIVRQHIQLTDRIAQLVDARMLPTEQATLTRTMRNDIIDALAAGKMPDEAMRRFFGARSEDVHNDMANMGIAGAERAPAQRTPTEAEMAAEFGDAREGEGAKHYHYREGVDAQRIDPDTGEITNKGAVGVAPEPYKVGGYTEYTKGKNAGERTSHDDHAEKTAEQLRSVSKTEVTKQGYLDYLREKYADNPQELMAQATDFMRRKSSEITGISDSEKKWNAVKNTWEQHELSPDEKANKHWYVLREEGRMPHGEATDIGPHEFANTSYRNKSGWGVYSAGDHGTVAHGRIWLERKGVPGVNNGKPMPFATSAARIIAHMNSRGRQEGWGGGDRARGVALEAQRALLHQGLASLLVHEGLTGRIGFKARAEDAPNWTKKADIPDALRMYSRDGATYGQARAQERTTRNEKDAVDAKVLLDKWRDQLTRSEDGSYHQSELNKRIDALQEALDTSDATHVDNILRHNAEELETWQAAKQDTTPELRADGSETRVTSTTHMVERDNDGKKFTTKKAALEHAGKGDSVVKRANNWVIHREIKGEERVAGETPQETMEGLKGPRSLQEDVGDPDAARTHNDYAAGGGELHPRGAESAAAVTRTKERTADIGSDNRTHTDVQAQLAAAGGVTAFNNMVRGMKANERPALKAKLEDIVNGTATDAIKARARSALDTLWGKSTVEKAGSNTSGDAHTRARTDAREAINALPQEMREHANAFDIVDKMPNGVKDTNTAAFDYRDGRIKLKPEALTKPWQGLTPAESARARIAHEVGHAVDHRNGLAFSKELRENGWLEYFKAEYDALKQGDPARKWLAMVFDGKSYGLSDAVVKSQELWSQLSALHSHDPALLRSRFPEAADLVESNYANARRTVQEPSRESRGTQGSEDVSRRAASDGPQGTKGGSSATSAAGAKVEPLTRTSAQTLKPGTAGSDTRVPATDAERVAFFVDANRRLGPSINASLHESLTGKSISGKKIELSGEWTKGALAASLYARNLGQVGAHEAFHEFFSRLSEAGPEAAKVIAILRQAADSPYVRRQLERMLHADGSPEAVRQIQDKNIGSAEERMAYMFQFHQAGLLKVGPETQSVFHRLANFMRKVVGLLSNDQKADAILRAFDEGKTQTADAAAKYLATNIEAREAMYKSVHAAMKPMLERASRLVNTTETNLERIGVKEYHDIRRLFKRSVGEDGAQGYLDAKDHLMKQQSNRLAAAFSDAKGDAYQAKDVEAAAAYLYTGEKSSDPVVKDIVAKLKGGTITDASGKRVRVEGLLPELEQYLRKAGVKRWDDDATNADTGQKGAWVDMGHVKDYFPHAYDTAKILASPEKFIADLVKYNHNELAYMADMYESTPQEVAQGITNRLINSFGQGGITENSSNLGVTAPGKAALKESGTSVGFTPFMRAINRRDLHWIHPDVMKEYGDKDISRVMTSYVAQAIKRAEYVRRFGNDGEVLKGLLEAGFAANVKKLRDSGMTEEKATARALKTANGAAKDVMAMEGTLGYGINPKLRKFQNSMLVYENMRTLSTSLFSQFIDPMGLVVRGGTMTDAWNSYKRAMREVAASIKGEKINDLDTMIADHIGTTDANGFLAAFGQLYSSQYMGSAFRKANDMLFRFNGMEGFNRGMQVSATRTAINFIKRHVEKPNKNSKEYLAELNLKAADVKIDPQTGELDYDSPKIQRAIHQWVNGAVMRPNAAQRPAWASDPHYMIFWHMKQFAYTFHDVIMKRAMFEAKRYGDMGPAGVLAAAYAPIMIAADTAKSLLFTGDEPAWMKMGLGSEITHGVFRAGLTGKFQPAVDSLAPGRSVMGLGGPMVEQISQMFTQSPMEAFQNALPGANVLNMMGGRGMLEMQGED